MVLDCDHTSVHFKYFSWCAITMHALFVYTPIIPKKQFLSDRIMLRNLFTTFSDCHVLYIKMYWKNSLNIILIIKNHLFYYNEQNRMKFAVFFLKTPRKEVYF